jgi:hypothetical protein
VATARPIDSESLKWACWNCGAGKQSRRVEPAPEIATGASVMRCAVCRSLVDTEDVIGKRLPAESVSTQRYS